MDNKIIYVICSGEYSDYRIHGYFDNEEDAEKWCEYHNKIKDYYCDNDYYVDTLEKMEITTKEKNPVYKKYYDITFNIFNDDYKIKECFTGELEDIQNEINAGLFGTINFIILNDDKDKALKIALDKKAELLYIYYDILGGNKYTYENRFKILDQDISRLKTASKLIKFH